MVLVPNRVIVLPVRPVLAGDDRRGEERGERPIRGHRGQWLERERLHGALPRGLADRTAVERRFVGQRARRHIGDQRAALENAHAAGRGHRADGDGVQIPLLEHRFDVRFAAALHDQQHALLRFREHDLVRRHAGLPLRHAADVHVHAGAGARAHLAGGAGQAGGAHVLQPDDRTGPQDLEAGLHQQLLHERVADLHRRPLVGGLLVELRRGHRRAVDAVASGLGPDVVHRVALAVRGALDDLVAAGEAEAEDVHQRVARVGGVEVDFAADRGNADAVAIAADAGDHAGEDAAGQRRVQRPEAQRVQQPDRPRAHGEDVADDAADAGGRALVGLDEGRMVVRFDLEDRAQTVADVHRAGVLPRSLHHPRPGRGQGLQVHARALVAAVLGPHHREQPELHEVGRARHQLADPLVFVGLEAVPIEHGRVDEMGLRHAQDARRQC